MREYKEMGRRPNLGSWSSTIVTGGEDPRVQAFIDA
jgi:hypothetical protein